MDPNSDYMNTFNRAARASLIKTLSNRRKISQILSIFTKTYLILNVLIIKVFSRKTSFVSQLQYNSPLWLTFDCSGNLPLSPSLKYKYKYKYKQKIRIQIQISRKTVSIVEQQLALAHIGLFWQSASFLPLSPSKTKGIGSVYKLQIICILLII